jgi:hypothetical protein
MNSRRSWKNGQCLPNNAPFFVGFCKTATERRTGIMARYGEPIPVPDPPEESPRFVSTKNDSFATRECLVWQRGALPEAATDVGGEDAQHPLHYNLVPAVLATRQVASGQRPFMRKKRTQAAPGATVKSDPLGVVEGTSPDRHHRGLRTLNTTRQLLGNPTFLESRGEVEERVRTKPPLWDWQKAAFDLRHDEHRDVRSPLQIAQDAQRDEDRRRTAAFQEHLRRQARYRPVNRVPLRKGAEGGPPTAATVAAAPHVESSLSKPRAASARGPRPPPLPQTLPTSALRPAPPRHSTTAGTDILAAASNANSSVHPPSTPRPILSARVRNRIAEMADTFLTPRRPEQPPQ